jgi:Fibrobacter succinogenes major domain (Fib_succ_major).
MNSSKLFLLLLFFASIAICQINITGKVVDTLGNPIRGAQVALSMAELKDTTDSTGQFVLASIPTENQINPYIKAFSGNPFIKNQMLIFYVIPSGTHVSADVFSVSGRLVAHLVNKSFLSGEFHVDMASLLPNSSKNTIYFVRLKIGNESFTIKWVTIGSTNFTTGRNSSTIQNILPKVKVLNGTLLSKAILDTLLIHHDGYFSKRMDMDSLSGTLGNIHLYSGTDFTAEQETTIVSTYSTIAKQADSLFLLGNADTVFKNLIALSRKIAVVETAGVENGTFYVKFKNGGIMCWVNEPGSQLNTGISKNNLQKRSSTSNIIKIDKRACVLCGPTREQYCKQWADSLSNYLIQPIDTIKNDQFNLGFITNRITDYDYVVLITHGNVLRNRTWIAIGKPLSWDWIFHNDPGGWEYSRIMYMTIHDDNGTPKAALAISDVFLKDMHDVNRRFRDNSFFYATSCLFLNKPEQMGSTLFNNFGCKAIAGWSLSNCTGKDESGHSLFSSLLGNCSSLNSAIDNLSPDLKTNCQNLNTNNCDAVSTCTSDNLSYLTYYPTSAADFKLRTDCVSLPQTPILTSPVDGITGQSLTPTLTWTVLGGAATYHVQVSTVNTFATISIEDSTLTTATKALSGLTNSTQYYWRVRAKNAGGVSSWTSPWSFTTVNPDPVTDIDGNVYHTIRIGKQIWTTVNLRTTRYNDGTSIPHVTDSVSWENLTTPAYCFYNNTTNVDSVISFGALYNWYAVSTNKLAPMGWHVPAMSDWDTLATYLFSNGYTWYGGDINEDPYTNSIGKSFAATTTWLPSTVAGAVGNDLTKNNRSGFSALPIGFRQWDNITYPCPGCGTPQVHSAFFSDGNAFWWVSDNWSTYLASIRSLFYNNVGFYLQSDYQASGHSVRLVKNN